MQRSDKQKQNKKVAWFCVVIMAMVVGVSGWLALVEPDVPVTEVVKEISYAE